RLWKQQVAYLARRYRVITIDLPGNGLADRPDDASAYYIWAYAGHVLSVLAATQTEGAVLVGNSEGAVISFLVAGAHPDLVDGVVLIGGGAFTSLDNWPMLEDGFLRFEEHRDTDEGWA